MRSARSRPKLTVATTFPIHPAQGGGKARVLGLYGAVAALGVDVDVVALGPPRELPRTIVLRPGLRELRVPASPAQYEAECRLQADLGGVPATDVAFALHPGLTPGYAAAVRASAADASAVVACHPYVAKVLLDGSAGVPLLYEAQDVEVDVKAAQVQLLDVVREHEGFACREAAHILTCSDEDAGRLAERYDVPRGRFATVPNGYAADRVRFTSWEERAAARTSVGVRGFTALFVGSWHGPNVEAARAVFAAAARTPAIHALVVGSVGSALHGEPVPANVDLTGPVDEAFLHAVLSLCDVAVNPVVGGSGTNLKMIEYAGAGIPILSSAFGARGLGLVPGDHYAGAEPAELPRALEAARREPEAETRRRVGLAYDHVRAAFDWRSIAQGWLQRDAVRELLALP